MNNGDAGCDAEGGRAQMETTAWPWHRYVSVAMLARFCFHEPVENGIYFQDDALGNTTALIHHGAEGLQADCRHEKFSEG